MYHIIQNYDVTMRISNKKNKKMKIESKNFKNSKTTLQFWANHNTISILKETIFLI